MNKSAWVHKPPFCWEKDAQNYLIADLIEYSSTEIAYIRVDDIEASKFNLAELNIYMDVLMFNNLLTNKTGRFGIY